MTDAITPDRRFLRASSACGAVVTVWLFIALLTPAQAHRTGIADIVVRLSEDRLELRLIVETHDLAAALGVDVDPSIDVPAEVLEDEPVRAYLLDHLTLLAAGEPCPMVWSSQSPVSGGRRDISLAATCDEISGTSRISLIYRAFFDVDDRHVAVGKVMEGAAPDRPIFLDRSVNRAVIR